jgi:hypothetical protein
MADKHPLIGNEKWFFNQPEVGFRAPYVAVDKAGKKTDLVLEVGSTCREGLINDARETFQSRLTNVREVNAAASNWKAERPELVEKQRVDLTQSKNAQLKLQWHPNWMKKDQFTQETFLKVCDVVIGPVAVLLGPWRAEGEWWRTDPKEAEQLRGDQKYVFWNGTDNWFLAHPATAAIATGLYRQCFHLCGAGVAEEILNTISEEEIFEVMSTNSQKQALLLIKKTRPWIEVPVGENGHQINYAFPLGLWRRLIRLQRAIRRVGYEESLGQTFHEGWGTTGKFTYNGAFGFWGTEGELTDSHRHLMKVGAPRRKTSVKSAKRST